MILISTKLYNGSNCSLYNYIVHFMSSFTFFLFISLDLYSLNFFWKAAFYWNHNKNKTNKRHSSSPNKPIKEKEPGQEKTQNYMPNYPKLDFTNNTTWKPWDLKPTIVTKQLTHPTWLCHTTKPQGKAKLFDIRYKYKGDP